MLKDVGKATGAAADLRQAERCRAQLRILESFGTVEYDPAYDYKAERRSKRQG